MTHKAKRKMARKMMTRKDRADHAPLFNNPTWNARGDKIRARTEKRSKLK